MVIKYDIKVTGFAHRTLHVILDTRTLRQKVLDWGWLNYIKPPKNEKEFDDLFTLFITQKGEL